jgi:hypothetical protein
VPAPSERPAAGVASHRPVAAASPIYFLLRTPDRSPQALLLAVTSFYFRLKRECVFLHHGTLSFLKKAVLPMSLCSSGAFKWVDT